MRSELKGSERIFVGKVDGISAGRKMQVGTAYFIDVYAAINYYAPYGFCSEDVLYKLDQEEIHLGKPDVPEGAKLLLDRSGGRYIIEYND